MTPQEIIALQRPPARHCGHQFMRAESRLGPCIDITSRSLPRLLTIHTRPQHAAISGITAHDELWLDSTNPRCLRTALRRVCPPPRALRSYRGMPPSDLELPVRKKFLRQNRDLAKSNNIRALRIRELENECACMLSENLELRGRILELEKQVEDNDSRRIADHALAIKHKLESQLTEWGTLLAGLGLEPPMKKHSPRVRKTARSRMSFSGSRPSPSQRRLREVARDIEELGHIAEAKSYPRKSMKYHNPIFAIVNGADQGVATNKSSPSSQRSKRPTRQTLPSSGRHPGLNSLIETRSSWTLPVGLFQQGHEKLAPKRRPNFLPRHLLNYQRQTRPSTRQCLHLRRRSSPPFRRNSGHRPAILPPLYPLRLGRSASSPHPTTAKTYRSRGPTMKTALSEPDRRSSQSETRLEVARRSRSSPISERRLVRGRLPTSPHASLYRRRAPMTTLVRRKSPNCRTTRSPQPKRTWSSPRHRKNDRRRRQRMLRRSSLKRSRSNPCPYLNCRLQQPSN